MKNIYLLPIVWLFLGSYSPLRAQDWLPVIPGETQHYRLPGAQHITHSLRIDSSRLENGNLVFYLNRILQSTIIDANPAQGYPGTRLNLGQQGQFLGKYMYIQPNGNLVIESYNYFSDTSFVIKMSAQAGDSWVADAQNNLNATVTQVVAGDVLGFPDSLKTIQFSNGAVWVLSKHHGLLSAPDFQSQNQIATLSGLENAGVGDRLFRLEDMFDWNTGDLFQYDSDYLGIFGETRTYWEMEILQKNLLPDGYEYVVKNTSKSINTGAFPGIYYKKDTISLLFTPSTYANIGRYNGELIAGVPNISLSDLFTYATHFDNGIYFGANPVFPMSDTSRCGVLRIPNDPNQWLYYIDEAMECNGNMYYEVFRPQLGRTELSQSYVDNYYAERLTGAIIQGDTIWGSIQPHWTFTSAHEPESAGKLEIYPNPAQSEVRLSLPGHQARVCLIDAGGRILRVYDTEIAGPFRLDLEGLPEGLYGVTVASESRQFFGKIMIIR